MKAQKKTGGTGSRKLKVRKQPIRDLEPLQSGARRVRGGALRDGWAGKKAGRRE